MTKPGYASSFIAEAPILPRRVVKMGATTGNVLQSAAAGDAHLGVSDLGQDTAGGRLDVILDGGAEATAGAAIASGARLTSDSQGRVIAATAGAGQIVGIALADATSAGEIIPINVSPGR